LLGIEKEERKVYDKSRKKNVYLSQEEAKIVEK